MKKRLKISKTNMSERPGVSEQLLPRFLKSTGIEIISAPPGKTMDITSQLKDPEEFHGDPTKIHQVIKYGPFFRELIGEYDSEDWHNPEKLKIRGIVVAEHHYDEARHIMNKINELALRIIGDIKLYEDKAVTNEYGALARAGYTLLRDKEEELGVGSVDHITPIVLERGALPCTRWALGLDHNAEVPNEVRVVTKRTHLKNEEPNDLTVTVKWRKEEDLGNAILNGSDILTADFVNPATGASTLAAILCLTDKGIIPGQVHHRSMNATKQGIDFNQSRLKELGIGSTFYTLGICNTLDGHFYLMDPRAVADAGDALKNFLPKNYTH